MDIDTLVKKYENPQPLPVFTDYQQEEDFVKSEVRLEFVFVIGKTTKKYSINFLMADRTHSIAE